MLKFHKSCATAAIALALGTSAHAAPIAYWQFDDAAAGATAGTVATQHNSPTLDGTGVAVNDDATGSHPVYSNDVMGSRILDGIGGPVINASNNTSLKFTNAGLDKATPNPNSKAGGRVDVDGSNALTKPTSFTIEGFVKLDRHVNYGTLLGKQRPNQGASFVLDTGPDGKLRARVDSQSDPNSQDFGDGWNQNISSAGQITLDDWHHFAATYDASNNAFKLYLDYVQVGQATTKNALVFSDDDFVIGQGAGGRAIDGWMDEIRWTDSVLSSDQFLVAVPEPASLGLLGTLSLLVMRRRR